MPSSTICALATPAGGAIGIIRVSGDDAIGIVDRIFRHGKKQLCECKGYTIQYGRINDADGNMLDEVLVSVFRAPSSYTGEDSVEIACHGSLFILREALRSLVKAGCRQARPGEFTQRAFLNGKMDLSQAEAVADLIASTNRATHKMAISQLKGCFSNELKQLRDQLLNINSLLELELDFSDHEELEFADRTELLSLVNTADCKIQKLAKSFETGNALKKGIPVAIVGKTNVGKSSLLNVLLQEDKAIVSDIHGTTRDCIEDVVDINGISFRFIDTAGIRETEDTIERIGIERTYSNISKSTIVLWVVDEQPTGTEVEEMIDKTVGKKLIIVKNKADLNIQYPTPDDIPFVEISAKKQLNINALISLLIRTADIPEINENSIIVNNIRHYESLIRSHEHLARVRQSLEAGLSGDIVSEDLKLVLLELADITGGLISTSETLNNIFSHFCIGK